MESPVNAGWRLTMAAREPDQIPRLCRFRDEHPTVVIGPGMGGTWMAVIPEPDGETVSARHTLRELMDKLDTVFPPDSG